jgi:acyl-CoA thioesterase I
MIGNVIRRRICAPRLLGAMAAAAIAATPFPGASAAPLKIVAVGASNTAGWGVGTQAAYPARLEALLRENGIDAHVANAGVSFSTSNGMLRRLESVVPADTSILILQPGGNDVRFFGSRAQRARNINAIVARMRARNVSAIVFENDVVPRGNYRWDGIHFTERGHDIAATWLLQQIAGVPPSSGREPNARRQARPCSQDCVGDRVRSPPHAFVQSGAPPDRAN